MKGSNTGVYIGFNVLDVLGEVEKSEFQPDIQNSVDSDKLMANLISLYSNNISFTFDLKGPSMTIDTACSSSGVCFDIAVSHLKSGKYFRINI